MQQVYFLLLSLIVSVVYATISNEDNSMASTAKEAGRYFGLTVGILVAIAWLLYFISP